MDPLAEITSSKQGWICLARSCFNRRWPNHKRYVYTLRVVKMKIRLQSSILCLFVIVLNSAGFPAQTAPSRDQWGEKFNSQGAKLTYKEVGRTFVSGRTVVTYNLFASGLPKGEHFVFWVLNVGGEPKGVADAYLNEEGKVVNVLADPQRRIAEDPIRVGAFGGKAEPIGVALISDDDRWRVFAQIVPFPLDVVSGPCHLSAIETGPYYSAMFIEVSGLEPNEELTVDQQSENESGQTKTKADDHGNYNVSLFPFVKGKRSGKARFNLASKSCKIGIEFPWGDGSYRYQ